MHYQNILAAFYSTPLALMPEKIEVIKRFLHLKAGGGHVDPAEVRAIVAQRRLHAQDRFDDAQEDSPAAASPPNAALRADGVQMVGRVAVVRVQGVIAQRMSLMEESSGGVSCERLGATIDSLVADRTVKSILLDVDSPGGSVFGVDELATKIRAARDQKKINGIANSTAASAAVYLLSQVSEIFITTGGWMGSIGVYSAHEDWSKFDETRGVKTTLVSAGKYKVEGNEFAPLSADARDEMQRQVDAWYGKFISAVAKGRGVSEAKVEKDFGQGRMLLANEAVAAGLADKIATFDQVLKRMGAYDGGPSAEAVPLDVTIAKARARAVEVE